MSYYNFSSSNLLLFFSQHSVRLPFLSPKKGHPRRRSRRRYSLPFSACSFAHSLPDILPYPRACLCLLQAHFRPLFTLSCTLSTLFSFHYRLLCQKISGLSLANHTAQTCNRSPTIAPIFPKCFMVFVSRFSLCFSALFAPYLFSAGKSSPCEIGK